jgi:hypothetical protein
MNICKCSLFFDLPCIYKIFFEGYIARFYEEHTERSLETAAVLMCLKAVVSCIDFSVSTLSTETTAHVKISGHHLITVHPFN